MRDETSLLIGLNDRRVSSALSNPNRQRLLDLLNAKEYLSTSELLAQSSLAWGTLLYHLDILIRAGLIGSSLAGKKRVYFRRRGAAPNPLSLEALTSPNLGRIIDAIIQQGGRCQHEFQAATGLSQRMCSYYLQKLQERGFVIREADGNRARYHATPRLLEVFQKPASSAVPQTVPVQTVPVPGPSMLPRTI